MNGSMITYLQTLTIKKSMNRKDNPVTKKNPLTPDHILFLTQHEVIKGFKKKRKENTKNLNHNNHC